MAVGRIRLNRQQAFMLQQVVAETRHRFVIRRADAKDKGEDLGHWQAAIRTITDIQSEIQRTIEEMGWTA